MNSSLTVQETRAMFLHVAREIIASKEQLTHADQAIGDGDHGIGMARGFESVQAKLESGSFTGLDDLFKAAGAALLSSIGGAAGAIYGTLFRGGAKQLAMLSALDSQALAFFLTDGLAAVQERGKAQPGDKTMVDALAPAAARAAALSEAPLSEALPAVAEAAREGVEATRNMVAHVGKAKTLGERSLGHPDPGALSFYLILKSMAGYVAALEKDSGSG